MERSYLEDVLKDQKEDFEILCSKDYCPRYEERLVNLESNLAQVIIGVRRSGKSTLCINVIKKSDYSFAYVNFDDERLDRAASEDLNTILACLYQIYGDFTHLFLDEIQNVPSWPLFVNRLLRKGIHILLTGSNARLLSGELATHLTGRHSTIELFPFSFQEYCAFWKINTSYETTKEKGLLRASFDDYIRKGGFPEIYNETRSEAYIDTIFKAIISNDIINRYRVRYKAAFRRLAEHMLNIVPAKVNVKELQGVFSMRSDHTVENYLEYLENAYLLIPVNKFSYKSKQRVVNTKEYPADVAFMRPRENAFRGESLGWRLETIVFIELLRRYKSQGYDVFYYSEAQYEVDFVVSRRNEVKELIQVSYDLSSDKTLKREVKALEKAGERLKCTNLTLIGLYTDNARLGELKGAIKVLDAISWLLSRE